MMAGLPQADTPQVVRASLDQRLHTYVQYNPDGASARGVAFARGAEPTKGCGTPRASTPPLRAGCALHATRAVHHHAAGVRCAA